MMLTKCILNYIGLMDRANKDPEKINRNIDSLLKSQKEYINPLYIKSPNDALWSLNQNHNIYHEILVKETYNQYLRCSNFDDILLSEKIANRKEDYKYNIEVYYHKILDCDGDDEELDLYNDRANFHKLLYSLYIGKPYTEILSPCERSEFFETYKKSLEEKT